MYDSAAVTLYNTLLVRCLVIGLRTRKGGDPTVTNSLRLSSQTMVSSVCVIICFHNNIIEYLSVWCTYDSLVKLFVYLLIIGIGYFINFVIVHVCHFL